MPGQVRFQTFFNAAFIGLALVFVASCGNSRSRVEGNVAPAVEPPPPGLEVGHMRPLLTGGFDEVNPTQEATSRLQREAAGNRPLLEGATSDVTQGTLDGIVDENENGTIDDNENRRNFITNDRVFLTITESAAMGVTIDAGNDGRTTRDLTNNAPMNILPGPAMGDMGDRRGTGLGAGEDDDPAWAYGTRTFAEGDGTQAGHFLVDLVDWSTEMDNYVGGGIWTRRGAGGANVAVGAFVDGEDPTELAEVTAATGTATYRGHSYGLYTTLPAAAGESNVGLFAAKATLVVDFGAREARGGLSGTISDFLFSEDREFSVDDMDDDMDNVPALEGVIGSGLRILLGNATITAEGGFEGLVSSNGLMVGEAGSQTELELAGRWGGRFYGTPPRDYYLPPVVGGTWGATGESNDPVLNGFALSFIGSFGTGFDYGDGVDLAGLPFNTGAAGANHVKYVAAADNAPLFVDGATPAMPVSSVTQGSAGTADRVFLTRDNDGVIILTNMGGVTIDVGNNGTGAGMEDLTSTSHTEDVPPNEAPLDRRTTMLGTAGNATDPAWAYTTRSYTMVSDPVAAGDLTVTLVDWSAAGSNDGYLGGGVWSRVTSVDASGIADGFEVGAFVDGGTPTTPDQVNAATGVASYYGHSYGRYSFNNNISGEAGPGYFAAKATLEADFGASTISGTVSNFLFSRDNSFVDDGFPTTQKSALEGVIGGADGLSIALGDAPIMGNSFTGTTTSNNIRLGVGSGSIDLTGMWGGRFYGAPPADSIRPPLVGGTWGAQGEAGGVGFSLIGSFGAAAPPPPPNLTFGTEHGNHGKYADAAGNILLFAPGTDSGDVNTSFVAQGSFDMTLEGTTEDAVYLTIDGSSMPMNVFIDVGNDGTAMTTDLTSAVGAVDTVPTPATNDRRRGTGLGTTGDATDPVWAYGTRSIEVATNPVVAGNFTVTFVDWSAGADVAGGYLGGGVWSRRTGPGDTELQVGAFVDGETPTTATQVEDATGTAIYRGHAYGRYSFNNNPRNADPADEANPGYFAAKAMLEAEFGNNAASGSISGTISDFLFSETNTFVSTETSVLEAAIGDTLIITLGGAANNITGNSFTGTTRSNTIQLGSEFITLEGNWGGRFYGTPARQDYLPQLAGGTFGATDSAGTVGFSLIGAFGTRFDYGGGVDLIGLITSSGAAHANHIKYDDAAGAGLLFAPGAGDADTSSVTQGSVATDAVYFNAFSSTAPTAVTINVGVGTVLTTTTLEETLAAPIATTRPGTLGMADNADDPRWDYAIRTFSDGTNNALGDDFTVNYVDWGSAADDGSYMGGGVWVRATGPSGETATGLEVGAFVDGGTPTLAAAVLAATGSATYRGHAYGRYSSNRMITSDAGNPGFFAAKATLTAAFGTAAVRGSISGTVSNFLFSVNADFTTASMLEAAIGGGVTNSLTITLGAAGIIANTNSFTGTTTSNTIRVGAETITLEGNWGGRFYGTPARDGEVPSLVGGTFGAADSAGGVGFSLIGSFGAGYDGAIPLPATLTFDTTTTPANTIRTANHGQYVAAAGNAPLLADIMADTDDSSVTQGSVADDAVFFNTSPVTANAHLSIDVDNSDAASVPFNNGMVNIPVGTDLRVTSATNSRLGTMGNTTTDPAWNYTTNAITVGTDENVVGYVEATFVNWSTDTNNYLGGGVWSRVTGVDGNGIADEFEVGAFVDGGTPTAGGDGGAVELATGTATYRGHAYGRFSFNNNIMNETGPGYFAAKATLTAAFGDATAPGTISGTVSNFLFSRNNTFTTVSALEGAVGARFAVTLGTADITDDVNEFSGDTTATGFRLADTNGTRLDPTGNWGGRFYGTPARAGEVPSLVGGTFGVAAPIAGGVGFSLIGSFGAGYDGAIPLTLTFATTTPANHAEYLRAADNAPLLTPMDDSDNSSVTQGSATDAVYFNEFSDADAALNIDVGNDGNSPMSSGINTFTAHTPAADRRVDANIAGWNYGTREIALDTNTNRMVDENNNFKAYVVDWTAHDSANYMAGGVWVRRGTGAGDIEVGAFVDGETPTDGSDTGAVEMATSTATYSGHAFGHFSFNNNIGTETGPGFFAAIATLNADFGAADAGGSISGEITNFLFSRDDSFIGGMESGLEGAVGARFSVTLGTAEIPDDGSNGSAFSGETTATGFRLDDGTRLDPTGDWGGRFYGAVTAGTNPNAPDAVGGTFGVEATSGTNSFSIIGAFGAAEE